MCRSIFLESRYLRRRRLRTRMRRIQRVFDERRASRVPRRFPVQLSSRISTCRWIRRTVSTMSALSLCLQQFAGTCTRVDHIWLLNHKAILYQLAHVLSYTIPPPNVTLFSLFCTEASNIIHKTVSVVRHSQERKAAEECAVRRRT